MELGPAFRALFDLLPEPMLLVSLEGRVLEINRVLDQQLQRSGLKQGRTPLRELSVDPPTAIEDYLQRCARSGQLLLGALSLRRGDGTVLKYQAAGAAFRSDGSLHPQCVLLRLLRAQEGRTAFIALNDKIEQLNREIVRRQHSEAALRTQRQTSEVTLASIGDAVIVTDAGGCITFLNAMAEALVGQNLADARGRPLLEVFRIADEETLAPVEDPIKKVFRTGVVVGLATHTVLVRPDGTILPIDDSAAPIWLEGKIIGAVLTFRDISERRRAEQSEREADRRKDEFLATLAHELRNPLAPISYGLRTMALAADDPAKIASLRITMERQLKHLVRLIDDLMDVSRITQGRIDLRRERVDLQAILQIAIETTRPLFESKQQTLRTERIGPAILIDGDLTRLAQVFSNLMNNSAKYSPPGAEISVLVERATRHVTVRIVDAGRGIPAEMLVRIFEMFVQVHGPGMREGLGIGLTLVKRLVELHGGSVDAYSAGEERGSTFSVRLPLAEPTPPVPEPPPTEASHSAGAGVRVLVADDNLDAARTLGMMLEARGHEVRIAGDGSEALQIAEEFRPRIALLDIGMPKMNGYQAARRIRARPWGQQVHLIALTGWGHEVDRHRASEAGFDRHLVKPAEGEDLLELIARLKT